MNIERAQAIDGGMNDLELEWLAEKASTRERVAEIGSLRGRSARAMADNMAKGSILICVDHFKGSEEHGDAFSLDDGLYRTFCANMHDHIIEGRVLVMPYPSIDASARIERLFGPVLDMVFIDASHDYDSVKADIQAWQPLLKLGGLLCGHDYGHPPIERVVRELFPHKHRPVPGGSIWEVL